MVRARLQFSLGTIMLAVALVAALMALLVRLGEGAAFLALGCTQLGICAIVYGTMWMRCRKEGREPAGDDYLAAERINRRLILIFLAPLLLVEVIWVFFLKPP
jgi:hypothetical protein